MSYEHGHGQDDGQDSKTNGMRISNPSIKRQNDITTPLTGTATCKNLKKGLT